MPEFLNKLLVYGFLLSAAFIPANAQEPCPDDLSACTYSSGSEGNDSNAPPASGVTENNSQ